MAYYDGRYSNARANGALGGDGTKNYNLLLNKPIINITQGTPVNVWELDLEANYNVSGAIITNPASEPIGVSNMMIFVDGYIDADNNENKQAQIFIYPRKRVITYQKKYQSTTWDVVEDGQEALVSDLGNVDNVVVLDAMASTAPTGLAAGSKWYNTTDKQIYVMGATEWGTHTAPDETKIYIFSVERFYWNGTDLIPLIPQNVVYYEKLANIGTVEQYNIKDSLGNIVNAKTTSLLSSYDNTTGGLTATNVQTAITELASKDVTGNLVDNYVNGSRELVSLSDVYASNHYLISSEAVLQDMTIMGTRVSDLETQTGRNSTGITNIIKGDYLNLSGTALISLEKSDSGVNINASGMNACEVLSNKDISGGYLGIADNGKVHSGFLPIATSISAGIVSAGDGIVLNPDGEISTSATVIPYTNLALPDVTTVKTALDSLTSSKVVFTNINDLGYDEPSGDFNPVDFATYCSNFPFGAKFVGRSIGDRNLYPKLSTFFMSALGTDAFDSDSVAVTIENLSSQQNHGGIKYTVVNGSQTTVPQVVQEYTLIADGTYNAIWEKTYGDRNEVCYYTDAEKQAVLNNPTDRDLGRTVISYEDGNVYQLKRTESSGTITYSWEQKTVSLPVNGTKYLDGQTTLDITESGNYVVFGDVATLNITVLTPIRINVLGIIGTLTLPSTIRTVTINSTGYSGSEPTEAMVNAIADGSVLGKYQIRCVAL